MKNKLRLLQIDQTAVIAKVSYLPVPIVTCQFTIVTWLMQQSSCRPHVLNNNLIYCPCNKVSFDNISSWSYLTWSVTTELHGRPLRGHMLEL